MDDTNAAHPLSAKIAVATVKRYLADSSARIRLHDLVHEETERVVGELTDAAFPAQTNQEPILEVQQRLSKYEALTETLRSIFVTGCYWGESSHVSLWTGALQRVANATGSRSGSVYLLELRRYPALILLYAAGLAAIAGEHYDTLAALLTKPQILDESSQRQPMCSEVYAIGVVDTDIARQLPGLERHFTPISDHLNTLLREPLREFIPEDEDYQRVFDRFEYLLALVHVDINRRQYDEDKLWGPAGRFAWRGRRLMSHSGIRKDLQDEIDAAGIDWSPLKAGLFGGSLDRAKEVKQKFDAFVTQLPFF